MTSDRQKIRPFVDFYSENKISPVSQDISDIERHFQRRESLYRHLGIIPASLAGRSVLEFGPGSGHNALYTSSLAPVRYVLVDANPTGIERAKSLLSNTSVRHEFVSSMIEEYLSDETFDFVFCEGVLPFQRSPESLLRIVSQFVKPGGALVISCIDEVSFFSETLRRLLAAVVLPPGLSVEQKVLKLLPIFESHLSTLSGMSRPHEDWILDNIIHPFVGKFLSIPDAINAVGEEFDVYGSSPSIFVDWRWYKSLYGGQRVWNSSAVSRYMELVHNFLDYRELHQPRKPTENYKLRLACLNTYNLTLKYEAGQEAGILDQIVEELQLVCDSVEGLSALTTEAIVGFQTALKEFLRNRKFGSLESFAPLFGRGQQYLSFIRRV